jgi:predicted helicase
VKNPNAATRGSIRFHDIGDYLTREDKLALVLKLRSIGGIAHANAWQVIAPDDHGNWVKQGESEFEQFFPLASKDGAKGAVFPIYSAGMKTNRDAWCYNSSKDALSKNIANSIEYYNSLDRSYAPDGDESHFKWCQKTLGDLAAGKRYEFDRNKLRIAHYRPFNRQWLYMDGRLNWSKYLTDRYFPVQPEDNRVICLSAPGFRGGFSALMSNLLPSIHFGDMAGAQCFPRYIFEPQSDDQSSLSLRTESKRDGISDEGLSFFQALYPSETITKDDLFFYVYGLLHSDDYRIRFADNLSKQLPRIPAVKRAADFWAFVEAGRKLSDLHCDYEQAEPYPITVAQGDLRLAHISDPASFYRVEQMRFGGRRPNLDKSTVIYNANITITGIPLDAYDYVVNGKPALEWVMERQCVKTDKASGIVNDANRYAIETVGDPAYPLLLFRRVISVSLETMKIVRSLPKLEFAEAKVAAGRVRDIDSIRIGIKAHWGDAPAASIALAIVDEISGLAASNKNTLRIGDILHLLNVKQLSDDIVAALAILVQSEFAVLRSGGELIDSDGERHKLPPKDFQRVLTLDTVVHPITQVEIEKASRQVVPIFEISHELFEAKQ